MYSWRDIEEDIYAERFYGGLVNIAAGQEVVLDTDDDTDRIAAPKRGQRSCVPVLKKGQCSPSRYRWLVKRSDSAGNPCKLAGIGQRYAFRGSRVVDRR